MAKKRQIRKAASRFIADVDSLISFTAATTQGISAEHITWVYDGAIIKLYRLFEQLMLAALVGAINNDTSTVSNTLGIKFPKHLTDEACEYLVLGGRYFDFKGRDGLLEILKKFVPDGKKAPKPKKKRKSKKAKAAPAAAAMPAAATMPAAAIPAVLQKHYLIATIEKAAYKTYLDQLSALRNYAAHESEQSRKAALKATGQQRISPSGAWLKRTPVGKKVCRFDELCEKLKAIASEIEANAPAVKTKKKPTKAGP